MESSVEPLRKPVKCPNCSAPSQRSTYPFCSKRCGESDLHRWFSGLYAVPGREAEWPEED